MLKGQTCTNRCKLCSRLKQTVCFVRAASLCVFHQENVSVKCISPYTPNSKTGVYRGMLFFLFFVARFPDNCLLAPFLITNLIYFQQHFYCTHCHILFDFNIFFNILPCAIDSDLQLLFTISMHVYIKAFRMCHTASVPSVY